MVATLATYNCWEGMTRLSKDSAKLSVQVDSMLPIGLPKVPTKCVEEEKRDFLGMLPIGLPKAPTKCVERDLF
jgi:hypothetical protein